MNFRFVLIPVFLSLLVGCATTERSTLLGMSIGASVGGFMGSNQGENRDQSTKNGAALGAVAGALFGYMAHKSKKPMMQPSLNFPVKEFEVPSITKPRVNCTVVPDAIEGSKWIEKHRVCVIDSPSTWSR